MSHVFDSDPYGYADVLKSENPRLVAPRSVLLKLLAAGAHCVLCAPSSDNHSDKLQWRISLMKTKLAVVVPPDVPLRKPNTTQSCDGIGLIASTLACRFAEYENYEVHLFAPGDSEIGEGVVFHETIPYSLSAVPGRPFAGWPFVHGRTRTHIAREIIKQISRSDFDIIHGHDAWLIRAGGWRLHNMMSTIHTCLYPIPDDAPDREVCTRYPDHAIVTVSKSQQDALPERKWFGCVYNGIRVDGFSYSPKPVGDSDAYILFMGRICPEKGPLLAIKTVIRMADRGIEIRLKIAGGLALGSRGYFEEMIKPWLDQYPHILEYVGEVGHEQKNKLYGGAYLTICPYGCEGGGTHWYEPFGVVPIESMACGTPVLIGDKASASEIITHRMTGYRVPVAKKEDVLVSRFARGAEVIMRSSSMREHARQDAETRWDISRMVHDYRQVYARFLRKKTRLRALAVSR